MSFFSSISHRRPSNHKKTVHRKIQENFNNFLFSLYQHTQSFPGSFSIEINCQIKLKLPPRRIISLLWFLSLLIKWTDFFLNRPFRNPRAIRVFFGMSLIYYSKLVFHQIYVYWSCIPGLWGKGVSWRWKWNYVASFYLFAQRGKNPFQSFHLIKATDAMTVMHEPFRLRKSSVKFIVRSPLHRVPLEITHRTVIVRRPFATPSNQLNALPYKTKLLKPLRQED